MAEIGKARTRNQPDIARAYHCDLHYVPILWLVAPDAVASFRSSSIGAFIKSLLTCALQVDIALIHIIIDLYMNNSPEISRLRQAQA
jgi:hypothetical protein